MFIRFVHGIENNGAGKHLKEGRTELFDLHLSEATEALS